MFFHELLQTLQEYHPIGYMRSDIDASIYSMLPVESEFSASSTILYLVKDTRSLSRILLPNDTDIYNILAFQKVMELPSNLSNRKLNLFYIDIPNSFPDVVEKISLSFAAEHRIHETMRTLTSALFSNRGSQYILDRAHELFKNPVFQIDVSAENILVSCEDCELVGLPLLKKIVSHVRAGNLTPSSPVVTSQLFDPDLMEALSQPTKPPLITSYNKVLERNQMTMSVRVKNLDVGVITVLAIQHEFDDYDVQLINRLSQLLSQELQKKSLFTRNPNDLKAHFLNHLISTPTVSSNYIYQMQTLRRLSELKDKFYLMVVETDEEETMVSPGLFPNFLHMLQPVLLHAFYLIRDTELVMLFNLSEQENIHELIDDFMLPKLKKYHLVSGISNMYRDLRLTYDHYQQAKKTVSLGAEYQDSVLNYFSDMAPKELLHYVAHQQDLLPFCMPELLDLLHYDQENETDLVTTLYIYLGTFGKASTAAQILFIHKNTLLYRISKIKEILHCNLDHGEDIYKLMMSLRILRTLRLYTLPPDFEKYRL